MNLVGNAIKFTSEGQVVISVTFNKNNLKITVSDTGIGVTEEQLTHLFNTYTQSSKSTKRIYGGTGLGLTISKHLVELMGGDIGVRSVSGKGSDFWFTLPLRTANRKISAPQTMPLRTQQRVLVVDPSSFYCKILKEQLSLWGLSVTCAISSRDAMLELDNAYHYGIPYDVILLENQLIFDDQPFGVAIHNNPKFNNVALILLSRLSHRNQFHGLSSTTLFSSCLLKPVPVGRLYESLCKIFADKNLLKEDPNPAPNKGVKRTLVPDVSLSFTPRVLVVDDNMINQKIAASMLQKLGCIVDVEDNGRAALNRFISSQPYDVIFMDVQMPQMNGYEAAVAIRKYIQDSGKAELDRVTIIALTASVTDERICLANGMQGFIIKPVRMQDFKNVLQNIQQKRRELED
jgi:CheY-like chemotaxis protein